MTMRDSENRKLAIIDGIPQVESAPGTWQPYKPKLADLADDKLGPWLLHHAACEVCGKSISLARVRRAFSRGKWPRYCIDAHRERAKKQRQRKRKA